MPRGLPKVVREHVDKARESALLAVSIYNNPTTRFRSGGFIVMMVIAWTSLLHAAFFRQKRKPYYRMKDSTRYAKLDGDYKTWELGECLRQYYKNKSSPARKNAEFFVGLRNKIEHRSMPELDPHIFGECQAFLFNFEDLLIQEFGQKYGISHALTLAIQFSALRNESQTTAIKKLLTPLQEDISTYLKTFRSSLGSDVLNDLAYSYKVFLIPKLANNPGQADVAVEFIKYDPSKPEQMDKYEKIASLIKARAVPVVNPGRLKPGDFCPAVEQVVKDVAGTDKKFGASYHHYKAALYYKIRPKKGTDDPRTTKPEYCQYDEAHKDYVYTKQWKEFLITEMKKPGQYAKVVRSDVD